MIRPVTSSTITPRTLGLPSKFGAWRAGQDSVIRSITSCPSRFSIQVVPTGGGKSLIYMAASRVLTGRTLILTSTKALQDQLEREFGDLVAVVKGKSAFVCPASPRGYDCSRGPCVWGYPCNLKDGNCPYHKQVREGAQARVVVTNYAFWTSNPPEVLGKFDMLVMDEAHAADDHVLDAVSLEIRQDEARRYLTWIKETSPRQVLEWIMVLSLRLQDRIKKAKKEGNTDDFRALNLLQSLDKIRAIGSANMVVDHRGDRICIDAISPRHLSEGFLFRRIPRVVMTSATLTRETPRSLGVKDNGMDFREWPSTFPLVNRPVLFLPTVRVDHRWTTAHINQWMMNIDRIIESRITEKGIIHAVSYDRCDRVVNLSKFKEVMRTHRGKNTTEEVEEFKKADPPSILVSPSMMTGYDFPDDTCRWQIIGKIAFPDGRPLIMKARTQDNPNYAVNKAIQSLVQACGRGTRSSDDWCHTFIIDDHFKWILGKYGGFAPSWWLESVQTVRTIPCPVM